MYCYLGELASPLCVPISLHSLLFCLFRLEVLSGGTCFHECLPGAQKNGVLLKTLLGSFTSGFYVVHFLSAFSLCGYNKLHD